MYNSLRACDILYHKSNLVYTSFFLQCLIFEQNNSAQTSMFRFLISEHYYFFEKLKIVEKNLLKLNCACDKVSHTHKCLNVFNLKLLLNYSERHTI